MAVNRYTYKQVDDWLVTELEAWEAQAETLASRLGSMSDEDPHRMTVNRLWQEQEAIIDVIGMVRRRFREYDRKRSTDASHDLKKEASL